YHRNQDPVAIENGTELYVSMTDDESTAVEADWDEDSLYYSVDLMGPDSLGGNANVYLWYRCQEDDEDLLQLETVR
ncbi:hypothetical protein KIPB_013370, partial [Kipferlia bialata]